ncbi:MAG: sugar phosphate nucleotidyltransferase, partial [Chloroflexota bacterium]
LDLGGQPILETLVRQLVYYGFDDIVVTSNYLSDKIDGYLPTLATKLREGITLRHEPQAELMGTAGGLSSIANIADDGPFLVMNGDLLCTMDYGAFMAHHRNHSPALTIGRYPAKQQIKLGILDMDANGNVRDYREKPEMTFPVSMGVYVYAPETLVYVPPAGWLDLPDLVKQLIADGNPVGTYPFDGYWLDVGTHDDFEAADKVLREQRALFLPDGA